MKIKFTKLIILVTLFISFSCSTDDKIKEGDLLNGSWNLSALYGQIPGSEEFSPGEVVWTFSEESNELIVVNNIEQRLSSLESGTYSYEVLENGESQILYVQEEKIGSIKLQSNLLQIDTGQASDGVLIEFQR
ncbi:hypothetical protein LB465_03115 [Salegentibacter sp. LM13S]|uniref:hypothetical protein n=1 Tax=Salegentibacter lacus TaxID=2873599 RepID=UPI001CCD8D43|nr:hypothetical protein [Salegentibacter lacus]MBZ9629757.1 hypothetical protein [Salegentibacter lacus]